MAVNVFYITTRFFQISMYAVQRQQQLHTIVRAPVRKKVLRSVRSAQQQDPVGDLRKIPVAQSTWL